MHTAVMIGGSMSSGERVIIEYYACMNARRLDAGAALVSDDCEFIHTATRERTRGPLGYRVLLGGWLSAAFDRADLERGA
jgi:hypothetical protein